MQELGLGVLGWTPYQFWDATPYELRYALRGWQRSQGIDPDNPGRPSTYATSARILSVDEVNELKALADSLPKQMEAHA